MSCKPFGLIILITYTAFMTITIYILCGMNDNHSIDILKEFKQYHCKNKGRESALEQRGNYLVYFNVIQSERTFKCHETVTLATMADYTYLDNLVELVNRWNGPISVAVYCPGSDFYATLKSIDYLRHCQSDLIKELVTFHLFHERNHLPKDSPDGILKDLIHYSSNNKLVNCTILPPYSNVNKTETYRSVNNLQFAINLARNIARSAVQTHYFLSSDIELYPSLNFIANFLKMIERTPSLQRQKRISFVLPVFEVTENSTIPGDKPALQEMFLKDEAQFFHQNFCSSCHSVPDKDIWISTKAFLDGSIYEFRRAKRQGAFNKWEPFFVGTESDPQFDERIYWEGAGDKMVQAYAQCLLDYDYIVLENAFLVHKPGIKKFPDQRHDDRLKMIDIMENIVKPELDAIYGVRDDCRMMK